MMRLDPQLKKVYELAEPLAHTMGMELLFLEEVAGRGRRILRLYLDRDDGTVTIDDCADFSRALDPILDVEGPARGRYQLEVSSPGLNRPLVQPRHFRNQLEKIIELSTHEEVQGRKNFKGTLTKADLDDAGGIQIKVDQTDFEIPYLNIKKAHLDYFASEKNVVSKKKPLAFRKKKGKHHGA